MWVLQSALSQGVTGGLLLALNVVCVMLIFTLITAVILGYGDKHLYIMLGLAFGLLMSVNW
jgi:hypothetical protein